VFADVESPGSLGRFGLSRWIRSQGLATKIILAGTVEHAAEKAGDLCEQGSVLAKQKLVDSRQAGFGGAPS